MPRKRKPPSALKGIPLARITVPQQFGIPAKKSGLAEVVSLLSNHEFRADVMAIHEAIGVPGPADPAWGTPEWDTHAFRVYEEKTPTFYEKWGVLPPMEVPPLNIGRAEERQDRSKACIIGTGRWGLIPVFPWTTGPEVIAALERIQHKTGKAHRDVLDQERRAQIADWLASHTGAKGEPISLAEIARVVWARTKGLRRRTATQAIADLSFEKEQEWVRSYQRRGLSRAEATRRTIRWARGSEAKGTGQVRKAMSRNRQEVTVNLAALENPKDCEPAAFALTKAFRVAFFLNSPHLTKGWLDRALQALTSSK